MLLTGTQYRDLGDTYLDTRAKARVQTQMVRRLERLGFDVTLSPKQPDRGPEPPLVAT
jgi:hypothetical protein